MVEENMGFIVLVEVELLVQIKISLLLGLVEDPCENQK
jgi:hypothetical protein